MRIVLLVTDLQRGGTPLRMARLARGLHAAGVTVHVGCLAPPGPVSAELDAAGIPTFACHAAGARDLAALGRLRSHIVRLRPDLIHATLLHANVAARLVGFACRVPVVSSTATIEVERRWHRVVERLTAWLDRGHIVNSAALADHVVRAFGLPRRRVWVVPPSLAALPEHIDRVAARAELGLLADEFVVAWVGRFDPVKRLGLLVQVAEEVTEIRVRFLLAGDGPERPRLERELRGSAARDRVRLLGWRDDVATVLAAADAFFLPSRTEGMPNALLEALACGLPAVASDIPAVRELAAGGEWIRLVSGDRPADFAAALLRLHADEAGRRQLGRAAAAWARAHLDDGRTTQAVLAVYRDVLGHGAQR